MHRLGWCLLLTCLVVRADPDAAIAMLPLAAPAALIGANDLRRLAPLVDRSAARTCVEWASIACGGVVVAGTLQWVPGAEAPGRFAVVVLGSTVVSLYALGLASWTASFDKGRLARRLRASVACWWLAMTVAAAAYVVVSPASEPVSGWTLSSRSVPVWVVVLTAGAAASSWWLLAGAHHVIKATLRELAAEDETGVSSSPTR